MGFLLELIASIIGETLVGGLTRRGLRAGVIDCDLRAVEGRVYNMGTEWSSGRATITHAHISFDPSMGIVGKREIDVDLAKTSELARSSAEKLRGTTIVELVTPAGHLVWRVDTNQLRAVRALLAKPRTDDSHPRR